MLTGRQKELLDFIRDRVATDGVSPSFEEMKEHLGLKSKSGVHRLVTALEERGMVSRLRGRARALYPPELASDKSFSAIMEWLLLTRKTIKDHKNRKISAAETIRRIDKLSAEMMKALP